MKLTLLSLTLFCYLLLALSRPAPSVPDKYSHLLDKVTKPYTNVLKTVQERANTNLKLLKAYLEKDNTTPLPPKEKAPDYILVVPDTETKENNSISWDSIDTLTGRNLASGPCKNNGQYLSTAVNEYYCNTVLVSKATYDALNGQTGQTCVKTQNTRSQCYCSYETYGDLCEQFIAWSCELIQLSHPPKCKGEDTYNYVYSYDGSPPCYGVETGQTVTVVTRTTCSFTDTTYAFEGVKPTKYEVRTQPTLTTPFTYQVASTDAKFKLQKLPDDTKEKITFTNWKYISFPAVFEIDLTANQLAGKDVISGDIKFTKESEQYAHTGRYYFEIFITTGDAKKTPKYAGGHFEQLGYEEPPAKKKDSHTTLIVLLVIAAVIVVGLIIGFNIYQKRKDKRIEQMDIHPLVENWE